MRLIQLRFFFLECCSDVRQ